jgi:hypothetical protein
MVNGFVQVLNEDVSNTTLAKAGVTLGPHHTAWPVFNQAAVKSVQSALS